jgi:hypothetical protein
MMSTHSATIQQFTDLPLGTSLVKFEASANSNPHHVPQAIRV